MSIHEILIAIMAGFAVIGALDWILGNRFGLGKEFENGFLTMGPLTLAMAGVISMTPLLSETLSPVVAPFYRMLGADPAMFAGMLLACDMGGSSLAMEMTSDPQVALLSGILTGCMLGATVVFTIPAALGILQKEDHPALAKGVLAGVATIPLGVFAGGITAGFPVGMILRNLTPVLLLAVLIMLGLWRAERAMIRGFQVFGKIVVSLITAGLAIAIVGTLTDLKLVPNMTPLSETFLIVGNIAIVLAGALPMVCVLTKLLRRPLIALGKALGISETAAVGLLATMVNSIATLNRIKDMDERGKVVNIAFAVSAAFAFGDHLGYAAGVAPEMLPAMIVGKLTAGVLAVAVALVLTKREKQTRRP